MPLSFSINTMKNIPTFWNKLPGHDHLSNKNVLQRSSLICCSFFLLGRYLSQLLFQLWSWRYGADHLFSDPHYFDLELSTFWLESSYPIDSPSLFWNMLTLLFNISATWSEKFFEAWPYQIRYARSMIVFQFSQRKISKKFYDLKRFSKRCVRSTSINNFLSLTINCLKRLTYKK